MLEFFTTPWDMQIMHWTMYQLISVLLQIGAGYFMLSIVLILIFNKT